MLKRVEEDWSFFNQAVRERAEGKPRQEAAPLKLVTPEPPPARKPALPPLPPARPVQPPAAAPPANPSRLQPLNVGWPVSPLLKFLFVIAATIVLAALIGSASQNAHLPRSATTGVGPGTTANNAAETGATEKVVTDYTTFNTVAHRSWKVVTGWKFANSHAARPSFQYCYLEVPTPGGDRVYTIEERPPAGRRDMPETLIPGLDKAAWGEAATKCVWHG